MIFKVIGWMIMVSIEIDLQLTWNEHWMTLNLHSDRMIKFYINIIFSIESALNTDSLATNYPAIYVLRYQRR